MESSMQAAIRKLFNLAEVSESFSSDEPGKVRKIIGGGIISVALSAMEVLNSNNVRLYWETGDSVALVISHDRKRITLPKCDLTPAVVAALSQKSLEEVVRSRYRLRKKKTTGDCADLYEGALSEVVSLLGELFVEAAPCMFTSLR